MAKKNISLAQLKVINDALEKIPLRSKIMKELGVRPISPAKVPLNQPWIVYNPKSSEIYSSTPSQSHLTLPAQLREEMEKLENISAIKRSNKELMGISVSTSPKEFASKFENAVKCVAASLEENEKNFEIAKHIKERLVVLSDSKIVETIFQDWNRELVKLIHRQMEKKVREEKED